MTAHFSKIGNNVRDGGAKKPESLRIACFIGPVRVLKNLLSQSNF
jgi:hypothetical protein